MTPLLTAIQSRLSFLSPTILVGALMLLLTIGFWQLLEEQEHSAIHERATRDTTNAAQSLESKLKHQQDTVFRLAERWSRSGGMSISEWNFDTALYLKTSPGQLYFNYIDHDFVAQRHTDVDGTHDLSPTAADTRTYPGFRSYLERAQHGTARDGAYFFTRPNGRQTVSFHTPLNIGGSFAGFVGGGADLSALSNLSVSNYGSVVEARVAVNGVPVFKTSGYPQSPDAHYGTIRRFTFGDLNFEVEAYPSLAVQSEMSSSLPLIVLAVGLLLTAAVTRLVYREAFVKRAATLLMRQNRALDQTNDSIIVTDKEGRVIHCNDGAVKLYGYSKAELIGMKGRSLFADDIDSLNDERLKSHHVRGVWTETVRVKTRNGDIRSVATSERLIYDGQGNLECAVSSGRDVTDEEANKARLIESESKFRDLFESSQDGIVIRSRSEDGAWKVTSANPAFLRLSGYSLDEISKIDLNARIEKREDLNKMSEAVTQLQREGFSDPIEVEYSRKDGSIARISVSFWRSFDRLGEALQTFSLIRDVTEQRNARERLEEAQRIARLGSWEHDYKTGVTTWSSELYSLFDRDPADGPYSWDEFGDIMDPLDQGTFEQAREGDLGAGETVVREFRVHTKDGSRKYFRETSHEVVGQDGEEIRRVGTTQDITEVRKLEEELRHIQKLRSVGQLTGGVAHDFNNILGVISSNAQYLNMVPNDVDEVHAVTERIVKAVQKGAKLTDQLLSFSRKQALNAREIDTKVFLNEITDTLSRTLGESIAVAVDIDSEVWRVVADENQLSNALINLAVNGRDAMENGGALKVSAHNIEVGPLMKPNDLNVEPGFYVALSVSDKGVGMNKEVREQALEPFFTTKEVGKGTGLGLSMVFGFAEQSNGGMTLTSEEGQGTTVTIYLPASQNQVNEQPEQRQLHKGEVVNLHTILLVEDQPDLRKINEQILRRMGHRVLLADDAEAALAVANKSLGIDVAFVDIILPGGTNGIELAHNLREINPEIRILFTSGYASKEVLEKLDSISHDGLFRKPINVREVSDCLDLIFGEKENIDTKTSAA